MNQPLLPDSLVNAFTVGAQSAPDVATLASGDYVAVWVSAGQDGDSGGVYAQRFTQAGERIGAEFRVAETAEGAQGEPAVAAVGSGFVVTWTQDDGSSTGIYARRFDAQGAPATGEFLVNDEISGQQYQPDITGLPDGGYAITWSDWTSYTGVYYDVRAKVFDGSDVALAPTFTVNTTGAGSGYYQNQPSIAAIQPAAGPDGLATGGFVVAFYDASVGDVRARIFDQSGTPVSVGGSTDDFLVNTTTTSTQSEPAVASLPNGRFAIAWRDDSGSDGSGIGVFAQIFEGGGAAVGPEFQVNDSAPNSQYQPAVAGTDDNEFLFVYYTNNLSGGEVLSRRFDQNGVEVAPETVVNELPGGGQYDPAIAALPGGDAVVVFTSDNAAALGDGDSTAVVQRLIGDPAGFTAPSSSPLIEAVSAQRSFDEDDLNAAPQRIDADGAAAVSDMDSADFDGGRLIVTMSGESLGEGQFPDQDADAQDQLGLDASGPVSVSGATVSVNGTPVGTISSNGADGADLVVDLNADATPQAVEILVEHLTYQNVSDDPREQRVVAIYLEDGDGAAADPVLVTIDIAASQDRDGFIRGEQRVNTVVSDNQEESAIAALADGGYISVWRSRNQDNPGDNNLGVFAQRYDANGVAVGGEFQVNASVVGGQYQPDVAGLSDGGWVIVWDDQTIDGVRLNRYDSAGNRTVTELQVETETSANQSEPSVAGLSTGGYVVTWTSQTSGMAGDGNSNAVKAQVFNAMGARVGGEIAVNEQSDGAQDTAHVAALSNGRFAVVWEENDVAGGDGSGASVSARVFEDTGLARTAEFQVNTFTAGAQNQPRVAALANGDMVVVWRSEAQDSSSGGIYAQRVTDQGVAVGPEIRVNDLVSGNQTVPDVIGLDTGGFVVSWTDTSTPSPGSGSDVFTQAFDADGTRLDGQVRINTEVSSEQYEARMVALPNGNYVVQWTSWDSPPAGDGSGYGVFQQVIGDPAEIAASAAPAAQGLPAVATLDESAANAGALLFPAGAANLVDPDSPDFAGGSLRLERVAADPVADGFNPPDNQAQDNLSVAVGGRITLSGATLRVDGVDVATIVGDGQDGAALTLDFLAGATLERVETLLGALSYQNTSEDPRDSRTYSLTLEDGDGGVSTPLLLEIVVTGEAEAGAPEKVGGETQVNSYALDQQDNAQVAALDDGGWVVVWRSAAQDSSGAGVFGQRYNADGQRAGSEFQVNTVESNDQDEPAVAGLVGGGWVVVWASYSQDSPFTEGVYGQRYNADGTKAGGEFLINDTTGANQNELDVAALPNGGFVVVWRDDASTGASYRDVKAKVFDAGGTELAPEFVVNTTGANASSYQYQPSVAAIAPSAGPGGLPGGGFVVAFRDDSSGSGEIRARVFDQSGAAVSVGGSTDDFMVNTTTGGTQEIPSVAGTADGGFVIAWADSSGQDGSGWGIAAQRYNGAGDPQGDEFVVNEVVSSTQYDPAVIGLDDGRFVVTWTNRSTPAPGSGYDVFAQVYAADGRRLDGEMRVNDAVASTQYQSAAAALPGGNFVVVYSSYNQESVPNTYGVFQQVLGDPADFTPGAALVAQGAPMAASFDEADVNAGLQRLDIDKTIALGDPDATDLDGGRLTLAVAETFNNIEQFAAPDGVAQDRLGLLSGDVGNGDVQIGGTGTGLVGETVSVDGVAVGTIASDGRDGQPFAIDLGALSTVEAVEALLGNLAYANVSDAPAPMRRLTLDLTNGDQQSIDTLFIDVAVTPDPDSTLIGDDERRVNAHTESTQGLLSSDGIDGSAQGGPESAELVGGGLVVVWTSYNQEGNFTYGVFGQRYDAAGRPVGPEFQINVNEASTQQDATVAATNDGGFIVVWEDHSGIQDGSSWAIVGRAFDAMGAPKGDEFLINDTASSSQQHPRVARLPDGDVLVVWQDDGGADGSSGGVFAQRLDQDGNLVNFDGTVTPFTVPASLAADYQLNGSAADALGGPAMTLPDPADLGATTYDFDLSSYVFGVSDGPSIANVLASGETYSIEMRFSVDSPNQSWVKILDFKDQTNDTGLYLRSGQLNFWNVTGSVGPVLQPGEMVTFILTRDGATDRVTGYLDGREVFSFTDSSDLAVLSGPDEIIHLLIDDGNPGESSSGEIDYVRMYDAALSEPEVRGLFPNVRTDERLVNTTTVGAQVSPDVAALAADADLPSGGSVVVWRGPDASQNGVYGQIYDINGVAQGGEFQINTTTDGQQFDPAVIGLTGGGFVVVWVDAATDGNSWGVFGQMFDNAGMALGQEFRVNTVTASSQRDAEVTALSDGGFVVTWSDPSGQDGSGWGVFGQRFDANGARIDGEFQVNQEFSSTQYGAAVESFGDGFAVVFDAETSAGSGDGSSTGVFLRTFEQTPPVDTSPTIGEFARTVTLYADDVTMGARVLDDAVAFDDPDSANLNGGRVEVYYTTANSAFDQLAIAATGPVTITAAGAAGAADDVVNVNGTPVGTIDATATGEDGAALVVHLNAAADPAAVKTLLEHIAFASTDSAANVQNTQRGIGFLVTDGAGGQSEPDSIYVSIASGASNPSGLAITDWGLSENEQELEAGPVLESALIAAPIVIDANIDFDDFAGTSFENGFVLLDESGGSDANQQLSVRNEGAGAGQIGFDGTNVTFGMTTIGTVDATENGADGANLRINLTAGATAEAIERLIENFTYGLSGATTDPNPDLNISVGNMAGAVSAVRQLRLDITRDVLTVTPASGADEQVNSYTDFEQTSPRIAPLDDGGYVIVWTSAYQDNPASGNRGIFAQIYNAQGAAVGTEFQVNDIALNDQNDPRVAGLSNGDFVVAWTESSARDGSGQGVFAQRFGGDGARLGMAFQINEETSSTQFLPTLVPLDAGRFMAIWTSQASGTAGDGSGYGVFGRVFGATGAPEGGEFQINTTTSSNQFAARAVTLSDGSVIVVWEDSGGADGNSSGVFAQRIDAMGGLVGFDGTGSGADERQINTTTSGSQDGPDVAALASGGFVFVWESADGSGDGIFAQIYDANGAPQGGEFRVNTVTNGGQYDPEVVGRADGSFTVIWTDDSGIDGSGTGVTAQNVNADGTLNGAPFVVNREFSSTQWRPGVTELLNGTLVATWASYTSGTAGDGSDQGVFQKLFDQPAVPAGAMNPVLEGFEDQVTLDEAAINAGLVLLQQDGALSLSDMDSSDFMGGSLLVARIVGSGSAYDSQVGAQDGPAQDQLGILAGDGVTVSGGVVSVDGDAVGTIDAVNDGVDGAAFGIAFDTADATPEAVERVLARLGYANASDDPSPSRQFAVQVTDGDGGSTGNRVITVDVTPETDRTQLPQGDEAQVNTFTPGNQQESDAAPIYDASGAQIGYVVVWSSQDQDRPQDGSSGVFAQRYDLNGDPVGAEFQVNIHTEFAQYQPTATGLPTGGFAVAWTDNSAANPTGLPAETSTGVYARIFDETGAPTTGEFLINEGITGSTQSEPEIAARANGDIVAVFRDDGGNDGSGAGVFLRVFDNTGAALGAGPVQVNVETSSSQYDPDIAVLSGGGYVATWTSVTSATAGDGSGNGVFARLFAADGTPAPGEFRVNTTTASDQYEARVAAISDGGFVVVWRANGSPDGSGSAVFLQRYDAMGVAVGGEVRVNETTANSQYQPDVIGLDTGGWVVAWYNDNPGDVFAQVYAADGSRQDGEFRLNTYTASTQYQPRLVALPGDAFAALWSSYNQDAGVNDYGVFQQVFAPMGGVAVSDDPVLTGLPDSVTFDEADLEAAPQQIAPSVGFGDADSADFAGGRLTVAMVVNDVVQPQFGAPDDATQDQLGFAAIGGVSVGGGMVSVNGTPVGMIESDGADGAPLIVLLNAAADAQAVEALIEALSYGNASDDPNAQRLISVQLTDGDGGVLRETVSVTITPQIDGGVAIGDEVQTNSYTPSDQDDSHVAALADGGYVIVWNSEGQDGSGEGVFAQRYDAAGAPVGGEIQVNAVSSSTQGNAQVVGLSTGGFAVAWEDNSREIGDDGDREIAIRVFDMNGVPLGPEFAVDSASNDDPLNPALAAFDNGDFAVVYDADDLSNVSTQRVYGQRYDDSGGAVGAEFTIPTPPANLTEQPDIAVQTDGTFVVVFRDRNVDNPGDNDYGVFLQRYAADGSAIGAPTQVNTLERFSQFAPRVAATEDGGYVVVYESDVADDFGYTTGAPGIYAQRFTGTGVPVGEEFLVNEVVDSDQTQPDVAPIVGSGGGFAVIYSDRNGTDGSGWGVFLQQYDAQGNRIDDPVQVNQETGSTQSQGAIAGLPGGNLVASFTSNTSGSAGDGSGNGVFHRLIGDPADFASGGDPELDGVNSAVTYAENDLNGVPQLIDADGAAAVSDPDSADFDGGSILVSNVIASAPLIDQINAPDDLTQDQLGLRQGPRITISGNTVSVDGTPVATIAQNGQNGAPFELSLNASATAEIVELLVENLTYRNISDDPLPTRLLRVQVTDGDGGASDPVLVTVTITPTPDAATPVGGEITVNTIDTGNEDNPAVATLPGTGGDFVVVWESFGTDGDREGVRAQRFDSLGNPLSRDGTGLTAGMTDEFGVNTTTANDQFDPQIAAFSDGAWVVTWTDDAQDTNGRGIFAQIYNEDGTPRGGEFRVNQEISSNQQASDVAVLDDDSFVVTWQSTNSGPAGDGNGEGVIARQFDSTGMPIGDAVNNPSGNEFVVNTETLSTQSDPSVSKLNDGGFLITWESYSSSGSADGDRFGIFGQRYDATGNPVGVEFQINTRTDGDQFDPQVAVLDDGNLVVAWVDDNNDLSGQGVFAQIIDPSGAPQTMEFRVNDQRINTQNQVDVAALDTGGFVIAWADSNSTDGSGWGVFAQQYDGNGDRIDSQFQVNTTTSGTQDQPAVSGLPGGGFVIAFNGSVLAQVYGNDAPTVSPVSASGDEDTPIVLDAAIFDAGFNDPNGNTLQAIRIDSFPASGGTLTLLGSGPVFIGQEISRADLLAGNLVYQGAQDFNGPDSFLWTGSDGLAFAATSVLANIDVNPVNDAPGLEAGANTTLTEGATLNRTLVLTDPDTDTRSFTVDFDDGSPLQSFNSSATSVAISHVYAAEGVYTVTVSVDDNSGAANAMETDSFTVTVINGDPIARNDFVAVGEDGPALAGDVLANNSGGGADSDPGGDPITVTAVNGSETDIGSEIVLASGALLTLNTNGTFSYDPNGQFEHLADFRNGSDSFTYRISDGEGGEDTATVFVTIDGQNDAPVAMDDIASVNNDDVVTGDVLANDDDPDNAVFPNDNALTVSEVNGSDTDVGNQIMLASGALLTLNPNGTFEYDTNNAFPGAGSDSFTYTVSDGRGGEDMATVSIAIGATNLPPAAVDDAVSTDEDTALSGDVLAANPTTADSDPDADPLTVSAVNGMTGDVGSQIMLFSGALLTLNADGTFSYDPNGQFEDLAVGATATDSFTYTISDGLGGSDMATVTVTIDGVNDAPVAPNVTDMTDEETATSGNVLGVAADIDGDMLVVSEVGGSTLAVGMSVAGSRGGLFTIGANGDYTYDPVGTQDDLADGQSRVDQVQYTVSDGNGGADIAFLSVTVSGVNDAPVAQDDAVSVGEDATLSGDVIADNGNGADADVDFGDIPFIAAVNGEAMDVGRQITLASGALLTLNGSGTFGYDPNGQFESLNTGETGADSFTYTLQDGSGATDTATVTITINGNADAPVAVDDAVSTDQDTAFMGDVLADNGGGADSDADGDTLTVTHVNGLMGNVGGQIMLASGALLTMSAAGTFAYDPNGRFDDVAAGGTATDSFTYEISDGNGGTDTATVTVTIDGLNDAPDARNDGMSADEDTVLIDDLFANNGAGVDADPDAGDSFTLTAVNGLAGNVAMPVDLVMGGAVTVQADGRVEFDPDGDFEYLSAGQSRTVSFTYTITDSGGLTDTATATITVNGVNDAPDAVDDVFNVAVNAALSGNVLDSNGLGPDTDPDQDDTLTIVAVDGEAGKVGGTTLSSGALLTLNADGAFDYDQGGAFAGLGAGMTATETFTYTVSDGRGGVDTATVSITIGGSNLPPEARDDAVGTDEDSAFSGDVLADNGDGADSDPNGDTLTVIAVNGMATVGVQTMLTSAALLTLNSDGTFAYDPNGQFEYLAVGETATDSFTYTVSDGNGGTDTATATVTITGENDAPEAQDIMGTVSEDGPSVLLSGVYGDVDASDSLTVSVGLAGTVGQVTDNLDGTFTYDPNGQFEYLGVGETATDSFTYTVSDGNGGTDTATATVTITGENDAPEAQDIMGTVSEDGPSILLSGVYGDVDASDSLTVSVGLAGTVGQVTDNLDGTFTYDPNGQFEYLGVGETATDSFTYTVSDGNGGTDTATATVTITGENDAPEAQDIMGTVSEDGPSILLSGVYADVDASDSLSVSVGLAGTVGQVTDNLDGTFTYDPNGQFEYLGVGETATDSFTYTVSDGNGGTDTATATVTVAGANDAPMITSAATVTALEGATGTFYTATATDPENDTLVFSLAGADSIWFDIDRNTGEIGFNGAGPDVLSLPDDLEPTIADGRGATDYTFQVIADDGMETDTLDLTVTVEADTDSDGVADIRDNAIFAANADQRDSNGDNYGNVIDFDLDGDKLVTFFDLSLLGAQLGLPVTDQASDDADFDGDGVVSFFDLSAMGAKLGLPIIGESYIDFT